MVRVSNAAITIIIIIITIAIATVAANATEAEPCPSVNKEDFSARVVYLVTKKLTAKCNDPEEEFEKLDEEEEEEEEQ